MAFSAYNGWVLLYQTLFQHNQRRETWKFDNATAGIKCGAKNKMEWAPSLIVCNFLSLPG